VQLHARDLHHQLLALGQKLVQRGVQQADGDRVALHGAVESDEIALLQRQQLGQLALTVLTGLGQDHLLHNRDAVLGKEHVLGPAYTAPVKPLMERSSPSLSVRGPKRTSPSAPTSSASHPATHTLPIWRATTAAWLVMPPLAVRNPTDAFMPWMSSGLVSRRTRIARSPRSFISTARSGVSAILPAAAPGPAGRPLPTGWCWPSRLGSKMG